MERRTFLNSLVAGTVAAHAISAEQIPGENTKAADPAGAIPRVESAGELRGEMLYRKLGSTGEMVSAIGMGGSHISKPTITQQEATRLIHEALDRGLNFLDNSWDYNEGRGERYVGECPGRGRLSAKSVRDDEDRRPHQRGRDATDRRFTAALARRPYRSAATPRGAAFRRPGPHFRGGRSHGSRCRGAKGG